MDIQEIGQSLLNELNEELLKSQNSAKLSEGAIQGVQLFYSRLIAAQSEATEVKSEIIKTKPSTDIKSVQKRKKLSK